MPETSPSLLEWGESTIKFIFLSLDYFPKRHARGDNGNANNKGKDSFRVIGSLVHDFPLLGENLILNRQTAFIFSLCFGGDLEFAHRRGIEKQLLVVIIFGVVDLSLSHTVYLLLSPTTGRLLQRQSHECYLHVRLFESVRRKSS